MTAILPTNYNPPNNNVNNRRKYFGIALLIIICLGFPIAAVSAVWYSLSHPEKLEISIDGATVTDFNLTTINQTTVNLSYNFALNITINNPNKEITIYYEWLEFDSYIYGERFNWTALPSFNQGRRDVTMFNNVVVVGNSLLNIGSSGVDEVEKEKSLGFFDVEVWFYGHLWCVFVDRDEEAFLTKMKVKCAKLSLPSGASNDHQLGFQRTECDWFNLES